MNNIASIERHLAELFPDHHIALVEAGWPYALKYELIGPETWSAPVIDKLIHITGCENTQLYCTLAYDDSGNHITTIVVFS